jgi:hypothetical protein
MASDAWITHTLRGISPAPVVATFVVAVAIIIIIIIIIVILSHRLRGPMPADEVLASDVCFGAGSFVSTLTDVVVADLVSVEPDSTS